MSGEALPGEDRPLPLRVLTLVNSDSMFWHEASKRVLPYLEHFGVPVKLVDLASQPLPPSIQQYPLVVLVHPELDLYGTRQNGMIVTRLRDALRAGTGVVSFDPALSARLGSANGQGLEKCAVQQVVVGSRDHFVTRRHTEHYPAGHSIDLVSPVNVLPAAGEPLVSARGECSGTVCFLGAETVENGRVLHWSSTGWMDPKVLGPLSGLDDLFWRGLAWAARKPFCLRGLPPLVTMRVDDVAARGGLWNESPLYWVEEANRAGLKPWLGLFLYNLDETAVRQLREIVYAGGGTVFPHAFGRPPRPGTVGGNESSFFYYENALPLRSEAYDEFIYFDHAHGRPWSDSEAGRGLRAVDDWFAAHAPLPMSGVAVPHWYEMGANTCGYVRERWGAEFSGKVMDVDLPLAPGTPWLCSGPFRRGVTGDAFPFKNGSSGYRPVYYADFANFGGYPFFNSITEIRDDAGYEWAPDNDIAQTVARAGRQLRRALDSMALASLFTHETDYIHTIRPENWRAILQGVRREIAAYEPSLVTLDDGMRALRATKTARLTDACLRGKEVQVIFSGVSDVPTSFWIYTGQDEEGRLVDVPLIEGTGEVRVQL